MSFVPNTDADRAAMLDLIGVKSFEELLSNIPAELRFKQPLDIPTLSEMEVLDELDRLADQNCSQLVCFAGGGLYDHFIPAAVAALVNRPEFMTAYTPYQAEVAQGTLQVIYEFQTHICRLTGMEVANASMYDGATAAAEAILICAGITGRQKVVISQTVSPLYREVIEAYATPRDIELISIPQADGVTDLEALAQAVDGGTACVLISQPNFFGGLEEVDQIAEMVHQAGGRLVVSVDPIAQAILKTPADCGADIVVGEGQPLGIPLSFGGPLLGFFATRRDLIRTLPGRIAARTKDIAGRPGFVLTLQTREQHIRRQRATSNICTNQALCATTAAVYLSLMGRTGLKQVALLSVEKAHQAAKAITALDGYEIYFPGPFAREFCVRTPHPAKDIIAAAAEQGLLAGIDAGRWYSEMEDCLIVACTEKRTGAEIAALVAALKEFTTSGALSHLQK